MITNTGRGELVAFLSGRAGAFGAGLALGVGQAAVAAGDLNLKSEVIRLPVVLRSPDFINGAAVYRAVVPPGVSGKFYEIGLTINPKSRVSSIAFGAPAESWTNASGDSTNARVGSTAMRINAVSSGNTTATLTREFSIPVGHEVSVNYFVGSNVSSAYIRLRKDGSNYLHYALPVTPGYNTVQIPLTAFTTTGTPSHLSLSSIVVYLASTSGGASQLHLDSIASVAPEGGDDLLVRQVLATPFTKAAGIESEIELPLVVSI